MRGAASASPGRPARAQWLDQATDIGDARWQRDSLGYLVYLFGKIGAIQQLGHGGS